MIKINKQLSLEPHFCKAHLNFSIQPETIPTLISVEKLNELTHGDDKPYFVVEQILDIDKPAKNIIYTKEFWESWLDKLKDSPLPGSKSGHTSPWDWWITGDMDFFTIGGEIKENSVFIKMYIPPLGYKSSNETFIKALKTGVVHFSIVSWTEDIIEMDENGNIKSIKAIRSVKGERNDATERDMGAMEQKVNIDKTNPFEPATGKKSEKQEVYIMSDSIYSEIIANLKNQVDNGTVSKNKIAADLKIEISTDEQKQAVSKLNKIIEIVGNDPVSVIEEMVKNAETVKQNAYDNLREKLMSEAFGPEKIGDKDNLKRKAAEAYVKKNVQPQEDLEKDIKAARENPVVLQFSFDEADMYSRENIISGVVDKNKQHRDEYVEV